MAKKDATLETRIQRRLDTWNVFDRSRQKSHRIRRVAAGDASALDGYAASSSTQIPEMEQLMRPMTGIEWGSFMITEIEEGRPNHIGKACVTLTQQTAYAFPEIDFESLASSMGAVNSLYLKWALAEPPRGCSARHEMRFALQAYLLDGRGWVQTIMSDNKPIIQWVDGLDVVYDLTGRTWGDMRWIAYASRQPLGYWRELAKEQDWNMEPLDKLNGGKDDKWDSPVEVRCYHDVEGKKGNCAYFLANGQGINNDPLYVGENPYTMPDGSPFLPLESCYYTQFLSSLMPTSIAELMLPAQVAIWEARANIRDTMSKGRTWMEYEKGAYDADELAKWQNNPELMMAIERAKGAAPMIIQQAQDVPQGLLRWEEMNQQEITVQSGVSPYQNASVVEGTKFAAEVNAVTSAAGLTQGTIAKDFSEFWVRTVRKFLAVAAKYDDREWATKYVAGDDEIDMVFDKQNPVRLYLDPTADIVVREDAMMYKSRQQALQEAAQDLAVVTGNPVLVQQYPNLVKNSLERYLRARGEKNITPLLAPPVMPQIDPAQAAAASTAA